MSAVKLEARLAAIEAELAQLKAQINSPRKRGWKAIVGAFAEDPIYAEAMKLGREYRESQRPKAVHPEGRR